VIHALATTAGKKLKDFLIDKSAKKARRSKKRRLGKR